ncbi:MAG: winged helix-turn-helix domain-containing protein [Nitrososphaerota archaeon]
MLPDSSKGSDKRRGRIEIVAEILEATRKGTQKTQIMYQAGLSFSQLTYYIDILLKSGLIQKFEKERRVLYKITSKGVQFLKCYKELERFLIKESEDAIVSINPQF